jgi:hypothetical protein
MTIASTEAPSETRVDDQPIDAAHVFVATEATLIGVEHLLVSLVSNASSINYCTC